MICTNSVLRSFIKSFYGLFPYFWIFLCIFKLLYVTKIRLNHMFNIFYERLWNWRPASLKKCLFHWPQVLGQALQEHLLPLCRLTLKSVINVFLRSQKLFLYPTIRLCCIFKFRHKLRCINLEVICLCSELPGRFYYYIHLAYSDDRIWTHYLTEVSLLPEPLDQYTTFNWKVCF